MSAQSSPENAPTYADSAFMRACRELPNARTPIWLMRQAGRYMREYRAVREKVSRICSFVLPFWVWRKNMARVDDAPRRCLYLRLLQSFASYFFRQDSFASL